MNYPRKTAEYPKKICIIHTASHEEFNLERFKAPANAIGQTILQTNKKEVKP
jgi:hypothetical protein